jgi:hypothetical protein
MAAAVPLRGQRLLVRRVCVLSFGGEPLTTRVKAFWNDCVRGPGSDCATEVDLAKAGLIWSDEVRGIRGNFLGLIDKEGRTIQFYFDSDVPDDVDDARHLRIVLVDFPQPDRKGSYSAQVTIGDVHQLIEKVFKFGADYRHFGSLNFTPS